MNNLLANRYKDGDDWGGDPDQMNSKQRGQTKDNTRNQGSSGDEARDAADQVDGIKDAQKNNPRAIENTEKSEQNLKNALRNRSRENNP